MVFLPFISTPHCIRTLRLICFFSGSSYGTFGLFIPLAVQLTQNATSKIIQIMTISAAISGSLIAAYSLNSDTLRLTSENVNSDIAYLRFAQLPYGLLLYVMGIISFLLSSTYIPQNPLHIVSIPLFTLSILYICYFIFASLIYKIIEKVIYKILIYCKINLICHLKVVHAPYPEYNYTFHLKYAIVEQLNYIKVQLLTKYIFIISLISFPLKMPGL